MTWTWRYTPDLGTVEAAPDFTSRSDAETWVGETWRELRDAGVEAVTLLEDAEVVYGPMSLDEG